MRGAVRGVTPRQSIRMRERAYNFSAQFRVGRDAHHIVLTIVNTIDLVLIDPQRERGKRTHDLMETVNAKKRWKTICWRVNKYLK
jgi:hypothetical protein